MGKGELDMLKDLVDYYDCVTNQPDTDCVSNGYSKVTNVEYKLVLSNDGSLKAILPNTTSVLIGKKTKEVGYDEIFPFRYSTSSISAEIIECRGKYLFGILYDKKTGTLVTSDKSLQAFEDNKKKNSEFLSALSSDVVDAYKLFLQKWNPVEQTENPLLIEAAKGIDSKFIIVVEGKEAREHGLHNDDGVIQKWDEFWNNRKNDDDIMGRCSITGKYAPIARTHNTLSGILGGMSSGVNLVCFNESAFCSYGKEQAYNSSISIDAMEKYTIAFNYLSSSPKHKKFLDDMTLLFWANTKEREIEYLDDFIEELWDTEDSLESAAKQIKEGVNVKRTSNINRNVDFFILGIKPNSSRLAIKIFYKDTFGSIMDRISKHQEDLKINNNDPAIPLWQLAKELKSPKSSDESLPPDLSTKILMSILNNRPYPEYLLQTVVRRVKVDKDEKDGKRAKFIAVNSRRVRIIKAYLTRSNYYKGDEYMIDSVSQSEAFKCGRLFAVLERIQYTALGEVNSTIKDKFFASACSTPQTVFCRLIKLAQPHLAKIKSEKGDGAAIYYDKLISDIVSGMNGFPKTLSLQKQGDFIIGYYQQRQKFFESKASGGEEQ